MESWKEIFESEKEKDYAKNLINSVRDEYKNNTIYPNKNNIFRALRLTSFNDVKVLILSQDPYHGPGQANGLAFAVNKGIIAPPSLRNIFQEIEKEFGQKPVNTELTGWAEQGVLMLNSILTVQHKKPASHKHLGWEIFTDTIITALNERTEPLAFLLWGSFARSKKYLINHKKHLVLEAVHPSPLSAYQGFFGCDHFKKVNLWLNQNNKQEIDWIKS